MHDATSLAPTADVVAGFGLDGKFGAVLTQLLGVCRSTGLDFRISNGLRTPQIQAAYYCKWSGHSRSLIDAKVKRLNDKGAPWLASVLQRYRDIPQSKMKLTGQLPGSGWHQWGLAADAYCYRNGKMVTAGEDPCYKFYAEQAAKLGLTAGFYFKSRDSGHVQGVSADGADDVYTWSYIDRIMKERFSEKTTVAFSRSDKPLPFVATLGLSKVGAMQAGATSARTSPAKPRLAKGVASTGATKTAAPAVPPPASEQDISVKGKRVYGPGNIAFGTVKGPGLYNFGTTTICDFFLRDPLAFPGVQPCRFNVIQSVSKNEGKIEAINTYDNSFLSCGIFQWTAGARDGAGELAGLLELLKQRAPAAFQSYFGSLGINVEMKGSQSGSLRYGYLVLDGTKLDTTQKKQILRQHLWAYRFWRAAHDQEMQRAQVALAMSRIDAFYGSAVPQRKGLQVKDFVSSEYGVALLLDEHVNRPGHVLKTLMTGVSAFVKAGGGSDPAHWTDADEAKVLKFYLVSRAKTDMTNSQGRANATKAHVKSGGLSDKRHTFK
jgi:hypothetical protein